MLPVEANILAALRRREIWEAFSERFPATFFPSDDARKVRQTLATLHRSDSKPVVPGSWVKKAVGIQLPEPLPSPAAREILVQELVKSRLVQWQRLLGRDLETGERIDIAELRQDLDEIESLCSGHSTNGDRPKPILASDLIKGKSWETRGTVPTFLNHKLDEYLGGGTGRGQLCLLQAPAKHGKTTLLLTIAYRAACAGLSSCFLSAENYLDQIAERLQQIHKTHGRKKFPAKFHVDFRYRMTIAEAKEILAQLPKLDVVVFDYADNMQAVRVHGDDFVWTINELYDEMRNIANQRNAVVWTATQEKDGEAWERTSSRARTYGSDKKFHKCDLFLGCRAKPRANTLAINILARRGRGKMGEVFHSFFDQDTGELKDL